MEGEPMTNREYINQLSDDDYIDWFYEVYLHRQGEDEFKRWLEAERTE
jgi:hypothetical protein